MKCTLCPLACQADRPQTVGACGVGEIKIAKYYLHPYEEPPISFKNGSGCVFFCGCSLRCVFCQNYELSRNTRGKELTVEDLAQIFRELEEMGADNINLVTPTQYVDKIAQAFRIYRPNIPVVYNTHGYETIETLKKAAEFVDIWMPDCKFDDPFLAKRYTGRANYPQYNRAAIEFMAQKAATFSEEGKMLSGCLVRHLMLPGATYDTLNIIKFIATLPKDVRFSLMSQYTPFGDLSAYPELQHKINPKAYQKAVAAVEEAGLTNVFLQHEISAKEDFIPKWDF